MVDDDDYEKVSQFKWFYVQQRDGGYAKRYVRLVNGRQEYQAMHHLVWGAVPVGFEIDHVDRNGINNQRHNLRLATRQQNNVNRRTVNGRKTSKYRGVSLSRETQKWRASITVEKRSIYLGTFREEEAAARAYNSAAQQFFGKFAVLNEIQEDNPHDRLPGIVCTEV